MPKRRPHARKQFIHAERLGDIIVGAKIKRLHLAGLVAAAGQHHDRNAVVAAADHPQQIMALDIRQAKIENDQIGLLGQQFQRGLAVRCIEDLIALRAEPHPQQLADRRLVIDDKNLERGGAHAAVSSASDASGIGSRMVSTAPLRSERLAADDRAVHGLDEAAGDRKSEAGAGPNMIALLRAIEFVEDAFEIARRNAAPSSMICSETAVRVAPALDRDGGVRRAHISRRYRAD